MTNDRDLLVRTRRITYLFMLTYFVGYLTRVNYGAVISEMVSATGFGKPKLSIALTGSFVTYGIGQIISGMFADRVSPKKIVAAGIGISSVMNLLIPFCENPYLMAAVWCVNGFAQAFLWPPIVRLMTENFDDETYKKRSVTVTYGSSLGTMAVYLASPLLISLGGYKTVFFVSAGVGALMLPLWLYMAPDAEKRIVPTEKRTEGGKKASLAALFITPLMFAVMAAIALQGMLRDGVTTWMPSLISESFDIGNRIAILTGVILPLFGILSLKATSLLYCKKIKNPLLCAGVIFVPGSLSALALVFVTGKSAILTILFTALLIAAMHGVNLILTCMIPPFFAYTDKVSTVAGIFNACTYVGSAVSTYAIAVISDTYSWTVTLIIWFAIAALGSTLCLLCAKPWNNKMKNK